MGPHVEDNNDMEDTTTEWAQTSKDNLNECRNTTSKGWAPSSKDNNGWATKQKDNNNGTAQRQKRTTAKYNG